MSKADRIAGYFPFFYRATQATRLLYEVVDRLSAPLDEADTLLFRIQRAHRIKVAEQAEDIARLAAGLNLTPFYFEDILAAKDVAYADKLDRMRERVWRIAGVHLDGLGTPWAILDAAAIFLDTTIVPERPGEPAVKHLDAPAYSHVASVEFDHLPGKPRERIYLHENPLVRRKVDPAGRWPLDKWTVANRGAAPAPVIVSIQGVGERTVRPSIFCPATGEGIVFDGIVPDGKTLLVDTDHGARIEGVPVDGWLISFQGGIYDFGGATVAVEHGREGVPFDGDLEAAASQIQAARPVPGARSGSSEWFFKVAEGVFDGSAYDYAVYDVPHEPIGVFDGDFQFDACVFDFLPSGIAGMAWDERLACAFKLLLPTHIPRPGEGAPGAPSTGAAVPGGAPRSGAGGAAAGGQVNYLGRISTLLPRFKAAGIRAYVDSAPDAWTVGESVLRGPDAADGEGIAFHATRVRDPRADLFVDAEAAV